MNLHPRVLPHLEKDHKLQKSAELTHTYHLNNLNVGFNPKLVNKRLQISRHLDAVILHFCSFVKERVAVMVLEMKFFTSMCDPFKVTLFRSVRHA